MVRHVGCQGQARSEQPERNGPRASGDTRHDAPAEDLPPARPKFRTRLKPGPSVLAGRAAVAAHIALQAPAIDHLGVETPIGADPEARQLSAPKQLVDR